MLDRRMPFLVPNPVTEHILVCQFCCAEAWWTKAISRHNATLSADNVPANPMIKSTVHLRLVISSEHWSIEWFTSSYMAHERVSNQYPQWIVLENSDRVHEVPTQSLNRSYMVILRSFWPSHLTELFAPDVAWRIIAWLLLRQLALCSEDMGQTFAFNWPPI